MRRVTQALALRQSRLSLFLATTSHDRWGQPKRAPIPSMAAAPQSQPPTPPVIQSTSKIERPLRARQNAHSMRKWAHKSTLADAPQQKRHQSPLSCIPRFLLLLLLLTRSLAHSLIRPPLKYPLLQFGRHFGSAIHSALRVQTSLCASMCPMLLD